MSVSHDHMTWSTSHPQCTAVHKIIQINGHETLTWVDIILLCKVSVGYQLPGKMANYTV